MLRMRESSRKRQRCSGCFSHADFVELCAGCTSLERVEDALGAGTCLLGGRYVFGLPLGVPGGFGITYHGWDNQLDRRVAIKEFFPRDIACRNTSRGIITAIRSESHDNLQNLLDGFLDEARRAARIEHEHVVRILDFTEENGTGYIVMPFYEGETLAAFRTRQPEQRVEWRQAVNLMFPVLSALDAVHETEMIHRDVKPSNIYLARTRQGTPRPILIDFGSARVVASSRELTGILTQGYAPLEQYDPSGKGQGPWSDVYAAAATLHELISGVVPPASPARQLGRPLADLRALPGAVPREFQLVLERALRLEPSDRIQSVDVLVREIAATTGLTPTIRRGGRPPAASTRVRTIVSVVAVVGGLAAAGSAARWALIERPAIESHDGAAPASNELGVGRNTQAHEPAPAPAPGDTNTVAGAPPGKSQDSATNSLSKERAASAIRERTARRTRANDLRNAGDYLGAWSVANEAEDSVLRKSIANACRADSVISARREALVQCPPPIVH